MSIRLKILFIVIPLIVTTLLVTDFAAVSSAETGISRVAIDFLGFKAQELNKNADNQWGLHLPHLMIVVPSLAALEGISTDPNNGGPYVMYPGTPYAHIMAPIMPAAMAGK